MTAPPLVYFGGKTTLAPRIAAMLPAHQHYVEPFCGGLSVLLAKTPSVMETANDLDGRLMTFWRVLRDRPGDLERVCSLTPHSRAEFQLCQDVDGDPADDELEVARRVWVRLSQGRGGTQRRTGWRNYVKPRGSSIGMPGYLEAYVDRMAAAAARRESEYSEASGRRRTVVHHLVLEDVIPLAEPVPARGALGLWRPPADVVTAALDADVDMATIRPRTT